MKVSTPTLVRPAAEISDLFALDAQTIAVAQLPAGRMGSEDCTSDGCGSGDGSGDGDIA